MLKDLIFDKLQAPVLNYYGSYYRRRRQAEAATAASIAASLSLSTAILSCAVVALLISQQHGLPTPPLPMGGGGHLVK